MRTWQHLCERHQYVRYQYVNPYWIKPVIHGPDCQWVCSCHVGRRVPGSSLLSCEWTQSVEDCGNGLLWVAIPKCGSTSIREKSPSQKLICPSDVSKFKEGFAVLRDPVDRFKSLVAMFFLTGSHGKHGHRLLGDHTDSTIVEVVLCRFPEIEHMKGSHHWHTQKSFIPESFYKLENPHFYDMGWLRENYAVSNVGNSSCVQITEKQRKEILEIYAEDVELYERYIAP
jgi:hypothetical protein